MWEKFQVDIGDTCSQGYSVDAAITMQRKKKGYLRVHYNCMQM